MIKPMDNTAVCCKTQSEYNALMIILEESGFLWGGTLSKPTACNYWHNASFCVVISHKILQCNNVSSCEIFGYVILNAPDLYPNNRCPDCNGSGVYVGFSVIEPCRKCKGAKA